MEGIWFYSIVSVFIVSIISMLGIFFTLSVKKEKLKDILIYMVSFSAGALFGDAFIHLLPEVSKASGLGSEIALWVIGGITTAFVLEKLVLWRHCHIPITKDHVHSFAIMNLIGDGIHNFIDGLIIGTSYLASIPVGIATTIAVIFHEIPQEIGDFGVLVYGGFSTKKALFFNFLIALIAVLGAVVALMVNGYIENLVALLLPFAAGNFIYIAGTDLVPELHKEVRTNAVVFQFIAFVLGLVVMYGLLFIE